MARSIPSADAVIANYKSLFEALNSETDMICVVSITAYIEQSLGSLLQTQLIDDSDSKRLLNGPLGTLSARALISRGLGLIERGLKENIDIVAQIRNIFAHGIGSDTFDSPDVVELCQKLTLPIPTELHTSSGMEMNPSFEALFANTPRSRFMFVGISICSTLAISVNQLHHKRLTETPRIQTVENS